MSPPPPIPPGAVLRRTLGPFTADTMPAGLRADHRTGAGIWGCLRVALGSLEFSYADYPAVLTVGAGQHVVIEPERTHRVDASPDAEFTLDIYQEAGQ